MNKPRFTGDDGRVPDGSQKDAKWVDLVKAMRQADPVDPPAAEPTRVEAAATPETPPLDSPPLTDIGPLDVNDAAFMIYEDETGNEGRGRRRLVLTLAIGALALLWAVFAGWTLTPSLSPASAPFLLLTVAAVATPLLLLAALWIVATRRAPDPTVQWTDYARSVSTQADRSLEYLASAENRLKQAYAALERQAQDASNLAEGSASALLATAHRIESQSVMAEGALRSSGTVAAEVLSLVQAFEERAPELDNRLTGLTRSLASHSADLSARGTTLEEQLRSTALVAEEARIQLTHAHDSAVLQMAGLRDAGRQTGDELTAMAELASARVELILERARTAMALARDGLQDHMAALAALSDQGERSASHVQSLHEAVEDVGRKLSAIEADKDGGQGRICAHLATLGAQAERVGEALHSSNTGAAHLIERTETLLLALDSNIREIDESLPAALGRFDTRLAVTENKLTETVSLVEGMAGTADAAARHMEQASETLVAQTQAVETSISASDTTLARQTAEIARMRTALDESAALMSGLVESGAPRMLSAIQTVRSEAESATRHAEDAINGIVARAAEALSQAGGDALDAAIRDRVNAQIAQIAEIADNAVKSAHRATDHLMREMMAITDTATDLEQRMAQARQTEDQRGRDHVAERSAQIIATLNDSAIDVTKWFNQDIGEREWASYLSGDKSLFARRAVRLLSGGDVKQVLARYADDGQFREHVNRYVEDFETMLADILQAPRGHSLAIALLSSDLGRLYVALAQAIERLRVN
ncbi:MAG TPA: hypothetical protein VF475_04490 [Sphingobium sp.]